jgi:hypothetical protein|nr:MAG TPA: hypothetical protein [Caudoviricetes sp.]
MLKGSQMRLYSILAEATPPAERGHDEMHPSAGHQPKARAAPQSADGDHV